MVATGSLPWDQHFDLGRTTLAMTYARQRGYRDAAQTRRLLAIAQIYEGATRGEAAKVGGVTVQIGRDWVERFNARGLRSKSLATGTEIELRWQDEARIGRRNKMRSIAPVLTDAAMGATENTSICSP